MTGKELALKSGLKNIAYWKSDLIHAGHTRKTLTGQIEYLDSAVEWLKNRPVKKPGYAKNKPTTIKSIAYKKLTEMGIKHPQVFRGWHIDEGANGWQFIEFGQSEAHFMGRNKAEVLGFLHS